MSAEAWEIAGAVIAGYAAIMTPLMLFALSMKKQVGELSGKMESGFKAVDQRFEAVEHRFDRMDARFDRMETRIDTLVDQNSREHAALGERIARVEAKLERDPAAPS